MRKRLFFLFLCLFVCTSNSMAIDKPYDFKLESGNENTQPVWNFTVPRGASKKTGTAPLLVHFSGGLTESTIESQPFHNYEYSWNFGDPTSGTWGTSGKSKNSDKGGVAAHVYETPGNYTATLTVKDSSGAVIDTDSFSITVTNPNDLYTGAKTTCLSTGTDFTGCPTGAAQVTTSDLSGIGSYIDTGERLLFRRGDTWTIGARPVSAEGAGPVLIGAFGTCTSPDELGICSNAPHITITGTGGFTSFHKRSDRTLMDLSFSGPTTSGGSLASGSSGNKNNMLLRVKTSGFYVPLGYSTVRESETDYPDHNGFISCRVENFQRVGIYFGAERAMMMGNIVSNSAEEHVSRVYQAYQGVISHNILSGTALTNGDGSHALKLHSPQNVGTFAELGSRSFRYHTRFAVVANNIIGGHGCHWPFAIAPQNDVYDERLGDIVVEKNRIVAGYGSEGWYDMQLGIRIAGRYITVRNNIVDATESASTGIVGIEFYGTTTLPWTSLGNTAYNNTIYSNDARSSGTGIKVTTSHLGSITIRNNYVSFPNISGATLALKDDMGDAVSSNNVLTTTPYFVDPINQQPLLRDFGLTSSSTLAVGQGYPTPVLDDFHGRLRTTPYDVGSFSF